MQCDGKIVAVGEGVSSGDFNQAVLRFNPDGSLDPTFGANGVVLTKNPNDTIGSGTYGRFVDIAPDGKIVVTGDLGGEYGIVNCTVTRYNIDGSLDNTFGTNGIVTSRFQSRFTSEPSSLIIQPDQKVIIGGFSEEYAPDIRLFMVRFNSDGTPDNSFGANGQIEVAKGRNDDDAGFIAMQPDGKVVQVGTAFDSASGLYQLLVARFTTGLTAGRQDTCAYRFIPSMDYCNLNSESGIVVPDAFTPNGDQKNDTFYVLHSTPINSFSLHVYDRWGQVVYSSTNIEQGWDGTYAGKPQPDGIYLWTLCAQEYESSQTICQEGKLTLLR